MLARDAERAGRSRIETRCDNGGVARVVELRPRVVGGAAVDCHPGPVTGALDAPDAVEGDARLPDERPAGLQDHLRLDREAADERLDKLGDGRRALSRLR